MKNVIAVVRLSLNVVVLAKSRKIWKKKKIEKLATETWNAFKEALVNKQVAPDDIQNLLTFTFLKQLDSSLTTAGKYVEVELSSIPKLMRGVGEKTPLTNYSRMIPTLEYAKSQNRMNPPGKAFIYLTMGKSVTVPDVLLKRTILRELRIETGQIATICKMYSIPNKSIRVLDLSGDQEMPMDIKGLGSVAKYAYLRGKLEEVMLKAYMNVLATDSIWKPIHTNEEVIKANEYLPFQALANYAAFKGYGGIIYRSTVYQDGQNLVLFNPDDVQVLQGSMEHITLKDCFSKDIC